jgi:hypothetical protein
MLPDFTGTETFEKLHRERMSVEMRFPHLRPTPRMRLLVRQIV